MSEQDRLEGVLAGVDEKKRTTLIRLIAGSAFVAPIIVSYPIDVLSLSKAQAALPNGSGKPI